MSAEPTHLDGNALGGLLADAFGREMTAARGCCGGCGAVKELSRLRVYVRAPGAVGRCPECEAVLVVAVELEGVRRLSLTGVRWLEHPIS